MSYEPPHAIIEKIERHTLDDAGCAVWQRSCCNGHPAIRMDGKTMLVRRVLHAALHGPIPHGQIVRMTCETPRCVHPEHISVTTYRKLGKQMGALGLMSGTVRSAAIAKTKRKTQAKLTLDDARAIRESNDAGTVLAARYGISQAHVSKVKLHKAFRDFATPWSGLL